MSTPLAWSTSAREETASRNCSTVRCASSYTDALPRTAPPNATSSSASGSWPGSSERGRAPYMVSVMSSGPGWRTRAT